LINYLLTNDKIQHDYVVNYTDLPFIVKEEFSLLTASIRDTTSTNGSYDKSSWDY